MLAGLDERDITDEQDQRFHASADRLADLQGSASDHLPQVMLPNPLPGRKRPAD